MRPTLKPEGPPEYLALWLNLGPTPVAEAMFSMPTARSIITAQRLGFTRRSSVTPRARTTSPSGSGSPARTRLLLQSLATLEHVKLDGERYRVSKRMRKWLDPKEDTYVGHFIESCGGDWWTDLDEVVHTGRTWPPDMQPDAGERYIDQYDLAKLSAPRWPRAEAPDNRTSLLDVAGGLAGSRWSCRRYEALQAAIVDFGQRARRTGDRGGARDVRPGEARGGRRLRGRPEARTTPPCSST